MSEIKFNDLLIEIDCHYYTILIDSCFVTQMTRICLPFSGLGVDEESQKEMLIQVANVKKGKTKYDMMN